MPVFQNVPAVSCVEVAVVRPVAVVICGMVVVENQDASERRVEVEIAVEIVGVRAA